MDGCKGQQGSVAWQIPPRCTCTSSAAPKHTASIHPAAPLLPTLPLPLPLPHLPRDVWIHVLFFVSSLVCLIFGLVHFFRGPLDTPLAISLIFMVYNIIPQFLLLQVRAGGCTWGTVVLGGGVGKQRGRVR